MNIATAKTTIKNADQVIAFIDGKLSEVSFSKVVAGYVIVPLDFDKAVTILTEDVCKSIVKHYENDNYTDVTITLIDGVKTLRMKSPLYD